jgi:molybdopterin/thiamine biosynthesis adenylyltransferase
MGAVQWASGAIRFPALWFTSILERRADPFSPKNQAPNRNEDAAMPMELKSLIENVALPQQLPDGTLAPVLSVSQIEELAIRFGTDGRSIEIAALQSGVLPERYLRNFKLLSVQDQIRLLQSKVTLVGAGGLGGTVLEWLARAGVGQLRIIDGDRFEGHNLNRQLLCTQDRLGTAKARAAAERVCSVNSSLTVEAHTEFLTSKNAQRLFSGCHAVVDCLDNIQTRFIVEAAAKSAGVPLISAAVAGLTGHVTTIFPQDRGLELLYGPASELKATRGAETTLGNLPQTVGLIASLECAEVIKVLLGGTRDLLRNKMLMMDLESHTYEVLRLV